MKSTRQKTPIKVPLGSRTPVVRQFSNTALLKDPVQVYLRIRPLQTDSDLSCLRVTSPTTAVLTPPEIAVNYKITTLKETAYYFKRVFDVKSTQRDCFFTVAQPLVEGLIRGKNGLLFTYGVTGSGKTYTMTGNQQNQGIMPRVMDVLFKTISDFQAKKYVFKPDRMNYFEVQSEADAMLDRQTEMNGKLTAKGQRQRAYKESDSDIASQASANVSGVSGIDEDNMYAVFVTYVEVYNNNVYDLLETGHVQTLQTKIVREDSARNMYVHGVTEIEVKSVEEAIDVFHSGQRRKRMGHTILNSESSRSHTVFTVRLVQAPTDRNGEFVVQDNRVVNVSQLSLVDLAGSERTSRTKNTGQRLREAGNINNSLMTLRNCLEILRENQSTGGLKKVPYREAKITHLFKNYFEGEGAVRMIVCVNPRAEDYDETAQVLKFAEMTQEVQVARPTPMRNINDAGYTPGRRKANLIFKTAINNLAESGNHAARKLELDIPLVYSLGPSFPSLDSSECAKLVLELMKHLELRIQKRNMLLDDFNMRQDKFRAHLVEQENELLRLRSEATAFSNMRSQDRQKLEALENKLIVYENSIDDLNRQLYESRELNREYERALNEKQLMINEKEREKEKAKKKFTSKLAVETEKLNRELDKQVKEKTKPIVQKARFLEDKLRQVTDLIQNEDCPPRIGLYPSSSTESIPTALATTDRTVTTETRRQIVSHASRTPARGIAVSNPRHRRSRSTGEKWLEHRAEKPVQINTIFQPYLKNRKSITKLTDVSDITSNKISNYCLVSQAADTDGEVETKLYKANIIPTTGGGAQVVFNDVECLKQRSPGGTPRKRSSNHESGVNTPKEVASRCSVGIEGHSSKKPRIIN